MKNKVLVDPKDKPFGRVLPFQVQVKIMFWVECFYTVEKRKKLLQELKGLPNCNVTGFPQHLGDDWRWNQVVLRLYTPRGSHCHHCHRLMDHRLSVRESGADMLFVNGWTIRWGLRFHCWQIGMIAEMARNPVNQDNFMNEGVAFAIARFQYRIPHCPIGRRPVMIGRRKSSYNTLDKVMTRLDRIMNVLEAMNFIIIDVQWESE